MYFMDNKTGEFLWTCPQCKEQIRFPNPGALTLAKQVGGCQGCRAKATFKKNPGFIGLFLEFWTRTNSQPQSPSWMEAIPTIA